LYLLAPGLSYSSPSGKRKGLCFLLPPPLRALPCLQPWAASTLARPHPDRFYSTLLRPGRGFISTVRSLRRKKPWAAGAERRTPGAARRESRRAGEGCQGRCKERAAARGPRSVFLTGEPSLRGVPFGTAKAVPGDAARPALSPP